MADPGTPPPLFDLLRSQSLVFEELRRIQSLLLEHVSPAAEPPWPACSVADSARSA